MQAALEAEHPGWKALYDHQAEHLQELVDSRDGYRDERDGLVARVHELERECKRLVQVEVNRARLREALEALRDVQNDPPLVKYQDQWNAAIRLADAALGRAVLGGKEVG